MSEKKIELCASEEMANWIRHAAKLRDQSMSEYIKRAINAALIRQGVDAVLFRERP